MRPDFKNIPFQAIYQAKAENSSKEDHADLPTWNTAEQIPVPPLFDKSSLKDLKHLNYIAGIPPYLRGPYSTMYVKRPWTIRQ